jgi:hypothetical protein
MSPHHLNISQPLTSMILLPGKALKVHKAAISSTYSAYDPPQLYSNYSHQGRIYGTGMPVPLHVFLLEPGANDPMCQFPMNLK